MKSLKMNFYQRFKSYIFVYFSLSLPLFLPKKCMWIFAYSWLVDISGWHFQFFFTFFCCSIFLVFRFVLFTETVYDNAIVHAKLFTYFLFMMLFLSSWFVLYFLACRCQRCWKWNWILQFFSFCLFFSLRIFASHQQNRERKKDWNESVTCKFFFLFSMKIILSLFFSCMSVCERV